MHGFNRSALSDATAVVPERITKHRLVGKRLRTRVECKAAALMQHHRPSCSAAHGRQERRGQPAVDRRHGAALGTARYHEPASGSARAGRLGSQRAGAAARQAATFLAA
jgi:hypothetical protein